MTEFYAMPNSEHFWHWPTLIHFFLVALAGGAALLAAVAAFRNEKNQRMFAVAALVLIVLDLFVLWLESPSRFRFTHIWLFLSFNPQAGIWLGAWGLSLAALMSFLLILRKGPKQLWATLLSVGAVLALVYPGIVLAVNTNRPLWTAVLLVFFPLTSMLIVLGFAVLLRQRWLNNWLVGLSWGSFVLGVVYLAGLALGNQEAREALTYLWGHGGWLFVLGLALLLVGPALMKRLPWLAASLPIVGALITRSLIIDVGQYQPFGF